MIIRFLILQKTFIVVLSVIIGLLCAECFVLTLERMGMVDTNFGCTDQDIATTNSRIHPYLGFQSTTCDQFYIEEKRYEPSNNEIVVGVFGGSVASNMAAGTWSGLNFEKVLQKCSTKKIKVINFAHGGWKQPQELLSLAYNISLGQRIDYVILVDGFNEAIFPTLNIENNLPESFPAVTLYGPIIALTSIGNGQNQKFVEKYEDLIFLKKVDKYICKFKMFQKIALGRVLLKSCKVITGNLITKYSTNTVLFDEIDMSDGFIGVPPVEKQRAITPASQGAQLWLNSHIAMSSLCRAVGASFFHYIQPNQYVSKHKFCEKEAKIAFGHDQEYNQKVKDGYKEILLAAEKLKTMGYEVTSLLDLFDDVNEQVYGDSCCHYNKDGEEILQNYIARDVAKIINSL